MQERQPRADHKGGWETKRQPRAAQEGNHEGRRAWETRRQRHYDQKQCRLLRCHFLASFRRPPLASSLSVLDRVILEIDLCWHQGKANPNSADEQGHVAINDAVAKDRFDLVTKLLEYGALAPWRSNAHGIYVRKIGNSRGKQKPNRKSFWQVSWYFCLGGLWWCFPFPAAFQLTAITCTLQVNVRNMAGLEAISFSRTPQMQSIIMKHDVNF